MSIPIDMILDGITWIAVEPPDTYDDTPYVTHEGVLNIADKRLKCFTLSNGKRVIDAEDFENFFGKNDFNPRDYAKQAIKEFRR